MATQLGGVSGPEPGPWLPFQCCSHGSRSPPRANDQVLSCPSGGRSLVPGLVVVMCLSAWAREMPCWRQFLLGVCAHLVGKVVTAALMLWTSPLKWGCFV